MVQNDKNFCLLHFISQEPYVMAVIYGTHLQNDNIVRCFFHFSKIWIFWIHIIYIRGVKGQQMVQNDRKFCLLLSISQEPNIVWLSFMVQMCKIISPGVFFNFQILIFRVVRAERAKNGPKWQKILLVSLRISGTVYHMIVIFGTHM